MRFSTAFVKKLNNSFDEGARNHDKLYFGVVRTPENNGTIVDRIFVADLIQPLEVTTQGRNFVSRKLSLLIDPQP